MNNHIEDCIHEINDIMALITKGNKWDGLASRMTKLLLQKWNDEQKEALRDAIRFLTSQKTVQITKEEFDIVRQDLESKLGANLAEIFRKDIKKIQLEGYKKAHTEIGIDFEFNTVDKRSLSWLFEKDIKQFWIGESYTEELNTKLNKIAANVMKAGLGRAEGALLFKAELGTQFERTNNYWELMSDHIVTRAREFGRTSAYEKANVNYIKIVNPKPVAEICKFMNGKIIPVAKAIEQRDKLLKAKSVDQVKKIAPWYSDKQALALAAKGGIPKNIGLPPYHGRCKSTSVIAYPDEVFNIE
ncbi:MAG: hypothetical protein PHX51_07095 [Clostridia bacterium]|nr:hypothetical protein [Clostridia bacterium]